MTAEIVLTPGNPGPVNEGERRVLQQLAERLPVGFELHPNLQITVGNGGMVEVDVVIFGPDCMWLIEVKDLAGEVRIAEHSFVVNGEPRNHPVSSTRLKAQKVKSRLGLNPALQDMWIQPLVVLAREPKRLDLVDAMRPHVMLVDRAVQVISDPSLIGLHRGRFPDTMRARAKARLSVDATGRSVRARFGEYAAVEMLASGGGVSWWRGRHHLLGNEVMLEVQEYDPLAGGGTAERQKSSQLRSVHVGQLLGPHPNLLAPISAFESDDGSLVVVHPMSPNPSLEVADISGFDESSKRRVVHGVALLLAHCQSNGVVHRILGPSVIYVSPQGHARVDGFGTAKIPVAKGATVAPTDWSIHGDFWAAPEHNGGDVGYEADLFALGKLIRFLWPDGAPGELGNAADRLTSPNPKDRGPTAREVATIARIDQVVAPVPVRGATVAQRYVLDRQLGSGAFATVWAVTDGITGSRFALKIYEALDAGDQVQREYRALENLDHPAVVKVRDVVQFDGKWALATELLEGPDLRAYILDQGPLSTHQAIPIVLRLLSGLQSLHPDLEEMREIAASPDMADSGAERLAELQAKGVIHRDVKPENVILVEGRGPVLVDFGLATGLGGGVSGGTIAYRPPDVDGDGSDPDIDLFAIGIILHELLTGRHPYTDRNPLNGAFVLSPEIPSDVIEIVARACAPLRQERFRSTAEFIGAIVSLGIPDTEIVVPVLGIVERLDAIETAMVDQRWDDALGLCEPEWVTVRQRIERRRTAAAAAGAVMPMLEAHGFSLTRTGSSRFELANDTAGVERGPGTVVKYLVSGSAGELLEVQQFCADDGTTWVEGGDTFQTPMPLQRIGRALRLGCQSNVDGTMVELRIAQVTNAAGWSNLVQVTLAELESAAGVDVVRVLKDFGATHVGTRADVIGDKSNRKNTLCAVGPQDAEDLPVVAHFLTRVLPLGQADF